MTSEDIKQHYLPRFDTRKSCLIAATHHDSEMLEQSGDNDAFFSTGYEGDTYSQYKGPIC